MRVFDQAFGGDIVSRGVDFVVVDIGGEPARVQLNPVQHRKIGALEWDATGVVLELGRLSGVARSRFVARFERAFQKGGG